MAWQPKGNCYAFYENSIMAYAPEGSGVYGLYNFDYQLYIGESANIRTALLQHLGEIECHPARFQPTGFAFELCAPELRALKAERLTTEYEPVRQTEWPRGDSWDGEAEKREETPYVFNPPVEQLLVGLNREVPANETRSGVRQRFYFARGQMAMLTAMFAASLTVIFFLGMLTGESIQKKASAGNETPLVNVSARTPLDPSGAMASSLAERKLSVDEPAKSFAKLPAQPNANVAPVESHRPTESAAPRKYPVSASVTTTAGDSYLNLATAAEKPMPSRPARPSGKETAWAVQLAANREKAVTEDQVAKLKAKGYDGYAVKTERDGQTWYRVRVGRFATRTEAEALREVLAGREGYRSPFITSD